ncbi:hypothetical protein BDD43_5093 [Mucilaginibacter gracilis]|uniref:Preprotein translocase subunit SecB n=1 Tax=Mucilaginibacter gracilis TaxID=423350 RepID=A0A495J773_9SPHI|nr:hypothetical protein [Mucilaginibacter gracilis]RKR84840.1 hypothetical protein BDD43_5093 [Mucilaginibacter gracilis]
MDTEYPPFEFGISRIVDCGFMIEEAVKAEPNKVRLGYSMNFLFDVPNSWIQFNVRADFQHSETGITFLSGTVLTRFSINNLSGFLDDDKKVVFPKGVLESLFGIAFSHMRAILAKNIAGSRFTNVYVPVIDTQVVFNELLKRNIEVAKKLNEDLASENADNDVAENIYSPPSKGS